MRKNDEITDEQLLADVANTEKKYNAYINLANGYAALSELPEIDEIDDPRTMYRRSKSARSNADECYTFLQYLLQLKNERGL